SLGHFQASLPPAEAERFRGLAVVRRLSGGGAILHHHELTYAVALPAGHAWADEPRQLYDRVHAAIVDVLQRHDLPVTPRGEAQPGLGGAFLCFSRGDSFDLVWQGHKVLGSAQRRRKG
ncbi:MAG: lipoyl protein ligase domain-containing protein, partial [Planctomycetaceae bacterium]